MGGMLKRSWWTIVAAMLALAPVAFGQTPAPKAESSGAAGVAIVVALVLLVLVIVANIISSRRSHRD